jgi:hypothetical protein
MPSSAFSTNSFEYRKVREIGRVFLSQQTKHLRLAGNRFRNININSQSPFLQKRKWDSVFTMAAL